MKSSTEKDPPQSDGKEGEYEPFLSTLGALMTVLGMPFAILAVFGIAYIALSHLGPNTIFVNAHYGIFIATLFFAAFILDAVFFEKKADPQVIQLITFSAFVLFLLVVAINITGIIADVPLSTGSVVSGNFTTAFGSYGVNVTDTGLGNFTGPLLFDMMEHVSLIGPGLAAVVGALIWHYKGLVLTEPRVKRNVLILMTVSIAWVLVLAVIGVVLVKTITYPPGV